MSCENENATLNEQLFQQEQEANERINFLNSELKKLKEYESRMSIEVQELEGMQEQMMADIEIKEKEAVLKDQELKEAYRTIEALRKAAAQGGGEDSLAQANEIAAQGKARMIAEAELSSVREDLRATASTVHIKEETIKQLKKELERALRSGDGMRDQHVRALEAEMAGLREALVEALSRCRELEGGQELLTKRSRSRPRMPRPQSGLRPPPRAIKANHHRFSERYTNHILKSC